MHEIAWNFTLRTTTRTIAHLQMFPLSDQNLIYVQKLSIAASIKLTTKIFKIFLLVQNVVAVIATSDRPT